MPRCADACPTEAIKFGEESEFAGRDRQGRGAASPRLGAKPRVYYLNMPEEVHRRHGLRPGRQRGRHRRHLHAAPAPTAAPQTVTTDGFGDFWFRGLADGADYKLIISAPGFADKTFDAVNTAKDVNLGDIALAK